MFGIVAVALLMTSVDQTILATALGSIQQDLRTSVAWSAWTLTVYALGQIISMPIAGKLSDEFGRKRIFLGAVALFTLSSLACGLADNIYLLIVLRALQSIGGGAFLPSATGIVADYFGPARDRAVGMFSSIFPIGGLVGPVIGGFVVTYWSWRGIFLVNVPIGILVVLLGWRFIQHTPRQPSARIDVLGIVLLGGMILTAMFGVSALGSDVGPGEPAFLVPTALAVVVAIAFVLHARHHPAPVIPIAFLRGRVFATINLLNLLFGAAAIGFGALVPLYAQQRYGLDPLASGTVLTARAVGMIAVSGLCVLALRRVGHRTPMMAGFLCLTGGLLLLSREPLGFSPYGWLVMSTALCGIGVGLASPAANNASLQLAPHSVAAITGLRGMFRQAGTIMSVSVATTVVGNSADQESAHAHVFAAFAIVLLTSVPLILLVPDHRGRW